MDLRRTVPDLAQRTREGLRWLERAVPPLELPRLAYRSRAVAREVARSEARVAGTPVRVRAVAPRASERPLRIVAALPDGRWEWENLLPALRRFGEVRPIALGRGEEPDWVRVGRPRLNAQVWEEFAAFAAAGPVDLFFSYGSGWFIEPSTLLRIRAAGARTFTFSLDDRLSFSRERDGIDAAIAPLVPALDVAGTSVRRSIPKYVAAGGRCIYFPEGADPEAFHPVDVPEDLDVVFVGQRYGWRPWLVRTLRAAGVRVEPYGPGWPRGPVSIAEMNTLFNRARVVLGFGGIQQAFGTTCIKGRDFEVPMAGGVYVAQRDPELAAFAPELLAATWWRPDELVREVRRVLAWDPARRRAHRERVRREALARHTWAHRVACVLSAAGIGNPTLAPGSTARVEPWPEPLVFERG